MRLPAALVLVTLGGAAGTAARVAVSFVFPEQALASTLAVNVAGAFVLGLLMEFLSYGGNGDSTPDGRREQRRQGVRLLLGTGFCGGFTTYSLIALQVAELTRGGDLVTAVIYAVVTLVLGGLAAAGGVMLATAVQTARGKVHA